jgi:hypothetical protein
VDQLSGSGSSRGSFWRAAIDTAVAAYLDCGILENGFARVRCATCRAGEGTLKPGMVAVVQTFGDALSWNPHVHALVTRGGWDGEGRWWPLPFVDQLAAAAVFRHKVLRLLARNGLLEQERIELLLSWRHSGFSVHNTVTAPQGDGDGLERLARYLLRAPVSLERLSLDEAAATARYRPRAGREDRQPAQQAPSDPAELLARVLMHIPQPRHHMVRYYGAYSSVVRARRRSAPFEHGSGGQRQHGRGEHDAMPSDPERRALRRSWAALIRRIYEVDPLVCPRCGSSMRILVFITEPPVILRILEHLARSHPGQSPRSPPELDKAE